MRNPNHPRAYTCKNGNRLPNGKCPKAAPKRKKGILRDPITGITKPAVARLAHVGGATRISGLMAEETRGLINVFLMDIMKNAIIRVEHARRKTIMAEDVKLALKDNGNTAYSTGAGKLARCPVPKGKVIKRVQKLQNMNECVHIPVAPFKRLLKQVSGEYRDGLRISAEASNLLHMATETYIIKLFQQATRAMIHSRRVTLTPKNVQLARALRGERG